MQSGSLKDLVRTPAHAPLHGGIGVMFRPGFAGRMVQLLEFSLWLDYRALSAAVKRCGGDTELFDTEKRGVASAVSLTRLWAEVSGDVVPDHPQLIEEQRVEVRAKRIIRDDPALAV